MRNERTSNRVAKIASRILSVAAEHPRLRNVYVYTAIGSKRSVEWFSWSEIQTVAASVLTQARDRSSVPKKRGPGRPKGSRNKAHRG